MNSTSNPQAELPLFGVRLIYWRVAQILVWLLGMCLLIALVFYPSLGLHAFWNVLITIAPALFVVAVGFWRNICPMATVALLPRHLKLSKMRRLSVTWQGRLNLIAVGLLLLILPLRQLVLNNSGMATAAIIIGLSGLAVVFGFFFDWKSGWCSSLCPVHPVEKLYGSNVAISLSNAHCVHCKQCVIPCPDSMGGIRQLQDKKTIYHRLAGLLIVGGFPGFIWGWFHVPNYVSFEGWDKVINAYGLPLLGLVATLLLYGILKFLLPSKHETTLVRLFSLASIACYYWFRLPALIGFGLFPGDGMLIDLSNNISSWIPLILGISVTIFFAWWMVARPMVTGSWLVRPPYDSRLKNKSEK